MSRVVVDAAAFLAWYSDDAAAQRLRREYEAGVLGVIVPSSFVPDVLARVADRGWSRERVERLGAALSDIGFEVRDAAMPTLVKWLGDGLTPIQSAYAALAEETGRPLVSADPTRRRRAAPLLQR
jgi:hypothetical protein